MGLGDSSEENLQAIFRELCDMPVEDDGLTLLADSVQVELIRDETEYGGIRVKLFGELASARVPIQADIGFGDAVTPEAKEIEYPTLLDNPAPHLKAYPRETVVAEKYHALVNLGMANSRMKATSTISGSSPASSTSAVLSWLRRFATLSHAVGHLCRNTLLPDSAKSSMKTRKRICSGTPFSDRGCS